MIVVFGLVMTATNHGLGKHIMYTDIERATYGIELLRISELMLILSTVFVKISISLFLMKLLSVLRVMKIAARDILNSSKRKKQGLENIFVELSHVQYFYEFAGCCFHFPPMYASRVQLEQVH